ncbi:metal-sulfur cluster assembly factor [Dehalococcoidia bacterium]|nr:metal-sulfur cluster assembly factor [Dehalococcoidia bacterium]
MSVTKEDVLLALKDVYDPEIPYNVVDLGLVYGVDVDEGNVNVTMTLTFAGCGMGPYIANNARERIMEIDDVEDAVVEMVFDPPWGPEKISDEIRLELGIE